MTFFQSTDNRYAIILEEDDTGKPTAFVLYKNREPEKSGLPKLGNKEIARFDLAQYDINVLALAFGLHKTK